MLPGLDRFTRQYLETMLWITTDESDEQGGDPLDRNYGIGDIASESIAKAIADCASFQEANAADLADVDDERAGHLFWLNRNGHGSGFWDEYDRIPDKATRERLRQACKAFGELCPYVGDDGSIYF